jgi:3-methyladenine DNA glycosylase AlkD
MQLDEAMKRLESLGVASVRERNLRNGLGANQFGVKSGDLRTLAKEIKTDPALATALWHTGNLDARMLAILLMTPRKITAEELEGMVAAATDTPVADWLNSYIVKAHPHKETLRQKWMESTDPMLARSAWSLTAERLAKSPEGLDIAALLDRIEAELPTAPAPSQWTMNYALAEIGINFPQHRERAIAIGERLGIYRDYPTPKGCTSPFAPLWITAMAQQQN